MHRKNILIYMQQDARYTVYFIWKHVEQFPDKINHVTLHLVGYILE